MAYPTLSSCRRTSPNINTNEQYNGRIDYHPTQLDLVAFSIYWTPVYNESYNGPAYPANLYQTFFIGPGLERNLGSQFLSRTC